MSLDKGSRDKELCCSFCGKPQDEAQRLIAGPGVCICDECIDLCVGILNEESEDSGSGYKSIKSE